MKVYRGSQSVVVMKTARLAMHIVEEPAISKSLYSLGAALNIHHNF
jgi:hypothetical protein